MATITTIEEVSGSIKIVVRSRHGQSIFIGDTDLRNKVAQLKNKATHILIQEEIEGTIYWVVEPVRPVHKTSPLYLNIHLDDVIQKLLAWYVDDERIVYIAK